MPRKALKIVSLIILGIFGLSLFAFVVRYSAIDGKRLGPIANIVNAFSQFPGDMISVLRSKELRGVPVTYMDADPNFQPVNKLENDLFALNSYFNIDNSNWEVRLTNLKNGTVNHRWQLNKESYLQEDRNFRNAELRNSILLENRQLIAASDETKNLYRLDRESNLVWQNNDKVYHHAMNLATDGNIWICSSDNRYFTNKQTPKGQTFRDDFITKVDINTGEILFDKSVAEILMENGYPNFVYGSSNYRLLIKYGYQLEIDPLHLNDIEPVFSDGPYWQKGDLFLSIRNRSIVLLYRPSTNKVIRVIFGEMLHQHDVDILNDSTISIFNNNVTNIGIENKRDDHVIQDEFLSSEILFYNFADSTFKTQWNSLMLQENILTRSQGFHQLLNNGDIYIENQNDAKVYIFRDNEIVFKQQFQTPMEGMVEQPHWVRLYENIDF